jgi:hypothetical protein
MEKVRLDELVMFMGSWLVLWLGIISLVRVALRFSLSR